MPPEQLRPLLGIEFGCRTSVVYAPPDPPGIRGRRCPACGSCRGAAGSSTSATAVQAQIDAARAIGINVLAYATNREVKPKDEDSRRRDRPAAARPRRAGKDRRRQAPPSRRLRRGARALANLMEAAARELKIRVELHPALFDITDHALFDYHLVFMHGRNAFHLTDRERAQLKTYVERGGMLLADSICASKAFTESFRREMAAIFPKHPLERIPADDPLLSTTYGGFDLPTVTRRDPQPGGASGPLNVVGPQRAPGVGGHQVRRSLRGDLLAFRPELRLEKHDSLECRGYIREDAARIGLNVLLYSLQE